MLICFTPGQSLSLWMVSPSVLAQWGVSKSFSGALRSSVGHSLWHGKVFQDRLAHAQPQAGSSRSQ